MQLIFFQMNSPRKQFKHLTTLSDLDSHISEVHFSKVLCSSLSIKNNVVYFKTKKGITLKSLLSLF